MFRFCTWNVCGLSKSIKRDNLATECCNYKMDICCIQETKSKVHEDFILHNRYRLIIMEQKDSWHGGLGFVISPRMQDYVKSYSYISDRVAVLDLVIPTKSGAPINYRLVNAYGPTTPRAQSHPQLVCDFYESLGHAVNVPSRWEYYICGDFNAKLGKVSLEESIQTNIHDHVGRYAVGCRNSNGEHLLNFLMEYDLFACNTAFQHRCRHLTTRTGWMKDWSRPNSSRTVPVYTQIDYILCRTRSKGVLQDARAYAGGTSIYSDHKIVMVRIDLKAPYLIHKKKISRTLYDISHLTNNSITQRAYKSTLDCKVTEVVEATKSQGPSEKLHHLLDAVRLVATDVIGTRRPQQRVSVSNDSVVVDLVSKRKLLRNQLNKNTSEDRSHLRHLINVTQKSIQKRLTELKSPAAYNYPHIRYNILNTHYSNITEQQS